MDGEPVTLGHSEFKGVPVPLGHSEGGTDAVVKREGEAGSLLHAVTVRLMEGETDTLLHAEAVRLMEGDAEELRHSVGVRDCVAD